MHTDFVSSQLISGLLTPEPGICYVVVVAGPDVASYPGPYTRAVRASFQGGIRAWYPLSYACAKFSQKFVK